MKRVVVALASLPLCLPCFACKQERPRAKRSTAQTAPSSKKPAEPSTKPAESSPPRMGPSGLAIVVTAGKHGGLLTFDGRAWTPVATPDPWPFIRLVRGLDAVYVVDSQNAVHRFADGRLEPFAPRPSPHAEAHYAVDRAGRLWAIAGQTVGLWHAERKTWIGKPIVEPPGKDYGLVDQIAVAGSPPIVWVAGAVSKVEGDRTSEEHNDVLFSLQLQPGERALPWEVNVLGVKPGSSHWSLVSSPAGVAYANTGMNLFKLEGEPVSIDLGLDEARLIHSGTAVSGDGQVLVASRDRADRPCWLAKVDPTTDEVWTSDDVEFACRNFESVALDDAGRAWVASEAGIAVVQTDRGEGKVREYPSLRGPIVAMLVVASGPVLP